MELLRKQEQPLLKRNVALYKISYEGTTIKRTDAVKTLAVKEKGTIVVQHIYPVQGQQTALVHAAVYKDASVATAVERKNLLEKQQPKAEEKPSEQAAEQPAKEEQ